MGFGKYHSVAICGFRAKGRKLYEFLRQKEADIAYIVERNYEALRVLERDTGVPIVGFDENTDFYRQADAIILSGDLPEDVVKECFELAGIDVPVMPDGLGW